MTESLDNFIDSTSGAPNKKLTDKLSQLKKDHKTAKGKGSLELGRNFTIPDFIPFGIPELDVNILGIGGVALGRVMEIAGMTGAGKTTLALNFLREAINAGKTVAIAENEGTFTYEYAEAIGMHPDSYHLFKGSHLTGPEFLEEVMRMCEIGYDIILIDSLFGIEGESASTARLTDAKMNTKMSGAQLVANFAKLWKNGWKPFVPRKQKGLYAGIDSGTTLITINHLKPNMDGYGYSTPGNLDIQFLYSQRIWLERIGMSHDDVDENGNPIYTRSRVVCQKSKLSPGGRSTIMYIDNRNGQFATDSKVIAELALKRGVVTKKKGSSWYNVNESFVISSLETVKWKLKDEQEVEDRIQSIVAPLEPGAKWQGSQKLVEFFNENIALLEFIMRFKK